MTLTCVRRSVGRMRFTRALMKESHIWRFKQEWQRKVKYQEKCVVEPSFIRDQGIRVIPATEFVKEPPKFPRWEPPVKDDPRYSPPRTIADHPDYKEDAVYEFSPDCCLIAGDAQACILTKSQPFYELPEKLLDLDSVPSIPHQDLLVQRSIMHANVWDPTKDKLPKRVDATMPIWKFKAETGIPHKRRVRTMIHNLVRLCEMLGGYYPKLSAMRRSVINPYLSAFYYFQGDKHVSVRGEHSLMVYSNKPLSQFADEEAIDASTHYTLPDMYPMSATIDLGRQHVWKLENINGVGEGLSHCYPHTAFIGYENSWTQEQRNATALMFCFGHALAVAKQLHGWEVTELPEPISTQCVMTNGDTFRFVCFQLNTLNFATTDGIKNFVWFDEGDWPMYNRIVPKRAMLRNTKYEDYDRDVIRQLFAFYVNGADLTDADRRTLTDETIAVTQSGAVTQSIGSDAQTAA